MRAHHDRRGDAAGRGHGGDPGGREKGWERITVPPGQKKAQNVRYAGEDLKIGDVEKIDVLGELIEDTQPVPPSLEAAFASIVVTP